MDKVSQGPPRNKKPINGKIPPPHGEGAKVELSLRDAALSYATQGFKVLPVWFPQKGECACGGIPGCHAAKHPIKELVPHGVKNATQDPATISRWWRRYPAANIGLALPDDVVVLDADGDKGRASLQALEDQLGPLFPTREAQTGGGGEHRFFKVPPGVLKERPGFRPGLDIKTAGGYVLAAPSAHISGGRYEWKSSPEAELVELPAAWIDLLKKPKSSTSPLPPPTQRPAPKEARKAASQLRGPDPSAYWRKALQGETEAVAGAPEGSREPILCKAALRMGSMIASEDPKHPRESDTPEILAALLDAARRNGSAEKYGAEEIRRKVEAKIAEGKKSKAPPPRPRKSQASAPPPQAKAQKEKGIESLPPIIAELNERYAIASLGARTVITHRRYDQTRRRYVVDYLSKEDLELRYENHRVQVGERTVSAATYWRRHLDRRTYGQVVFAPGQETPGDLNLWQGFPVKPKKGDWSLLKDHIFHNICNDDGKAFGYLLALMADSVQNLADRPGIVVVLRGKEGTGKGVFLRWWKAIFGQHGLQVSQPKHLTGNFNGHLHDCLFLYVDEGFWAGDRAGDGVLKALITEPEIIIERKGRDAFSAKNHVRIAMSSNEDWVIPAGPDARRYLVLDVSDSHIDDHAYFQAIDEQMKAGGLAAMLQELLEYPLGGVNLRAVPKTKGLLEQKILSLSPIPRFWYGRLQEGEIIPGRRWTELTPTREVYGAYLEETKNAGDRRRAVETTFRKELELLCPGLKKTRGLVTVKVRGPYGEEDKQENLRGFLFPPLLECRQTFERFIGQAVSWPPDETSSSDSPG